MHYKVFFEKYFGLGINTFSDEEEITHSYSDGSELLIVAEEPAEYESEEE